MKHWFLQADYLILTTYLTLIIYCNEATWELSAQILLLFLLCFAGFTMVFSFGYNDIFILLQVTVLSSTSSISLFLRFFSDRVLNFSKQKVPWKVKACPDQWHTWVNRFSHMKFALKMSRMRMFWQEMRLASDFRWRFELKQCVFT